MDVFVPTITADPPPPAMRPWSPAAASRLLTLAAPDESTWSRRVYLALALALTVAFFLTVNTFHAPAPGNPGIDENAYLVAGKNFARHFSTGFGPSEPYAYVGPMWIRASDGWYYPKYPMGVPVLNAIAIWIGGSNAAAFYVSPVCATLSVLGIFFLTRALAGSFLALLAAILLASNATLLQLALVPSSHAPAICFSLWGMCLLLYWWKTGQLWHGIAAGLLLGGAVTMRYTEALLLFPLYAIENPFDKQYESLQHCLFYAVRYLPLGPLGVAVIASIRWTRWRSYIRAAVPILAWALPVGAMVWFNLATLGTLTGYDPTHESTGFTAAEFQRKWEYTIQQLHMYGLFMLLPVGLLGMLLMFGRSWRLAVFMLLWFVPAVLLYMAYYWGLQSPGVGFLRFFLTLYPPVIASAMWLIAMVRRSCAAPELSEQYPILGRIVLPVGVGVFAAGIAAAGVYVAAGPMEDTHLANANMAFTARQFLDRVPAATRKPDAPIPLFLGDEAGIFSRTLMYMQFMGDGEWFAASAITPGGGRAGRMGRMVGRPGGIFGGRGNDNNDDDAPVLFDPQRRAYLEKVYEGKTSLYMEREETRIIGGALDAGRPVYALMNPSSTESLRRRLSGEGFSCEVLCSWKEPLTRTTDADTAPSRGGMFGGPAAPGGMAPPGAPPGGGPPARFGGRGFRPGNFTPPPGGGPGRFFGNQDRGGLAPTRGMRFGSMPQALQLIKITRKPAPATRPAR